MVAGQQPVRNELNIPSGRHMFQATNRRELLRQSFDTLSHIGPVVVLTLSENHAIKGQSPGLLRDTRKPQTLERNRKENNVTVVCDPAGVIPQGVEAEVVSLPLGVDRIGLYPKRIGIEKIGAVKIAEGVEKQANAVVLIGSFAFGKVCSNRTGFLMANKDGIKILFVVREISSSGLRRRRAVTGNVLAEIGDGQFGFARTIFEEVFQFGRAAHAGDF